MTYPLQDFTDSEASKVAQFEAATVPEELLREKVAMAVCDAAYFHESESVWHRLGPQLQDDYRRLADAALAVMRVHDHAGDPR